MNPNPLSIISKTLGVEEKELEQNRFKPVQISNPSVYKVDFHYVCVTPTKPVHKGFNWREWHDQYEAEQYSTRIWCADAKD